MTEANFSMLIDDTTDDLPRTFKRERDARERAKREEEERKRAATLTFNPDSGRERYARYEGEGAPAVVTRFDVPFISLMFFFIKAVFAAVPALIILGTMLWLAGDLLRTLFPWLVKMQILIRFPG